MKWIKPTIVIFVASVLMMVVMLPLAQTSWAESMRSGFVGRGQRERMAQGLPAEHEHEEGEHEEVHARGFPGEHEEFAGNPSRAFGEMGGVVLKMIVAGGATLLVVTAAKAVAGRRRVSAS